VSDQRPEAWNRSLFRRECGPLVVDRPQILVEVTQRPLPQIGRNLAAEYAWLPEGFNQALVLDAAVAGTVALGLNYGAYGAEVVRGSLNAVPAGQWETTTALSMPWLTKMRRVIWPQAWALMLPGFNNLMVMLVKGTAVVGLVLLADLTFEAEQLRRQVGTWPAFIGAMLIYYVIALVVSTIMRIMERRAQRRLGLGDFEIAQARKQADEALAGAATPLDTGTGPADLVPAPRRPGGGDA